jgi:hypothetical protein
VTVTDNDLSALLTAVTAGDMTETVPRRSAPVPE